MQRSCRQIPANVSPMTTVYDRKYEYQGRQKMHDFTFIFSSFPISQHVNRFSEMDSISRWLPGL